MWTKKWTGAESLRGRRFFIRGRRASLPHAELNRCFVGEGMAELVLALKAGRTKALRQKLQAVKKV